MSSASNSGGCMGVADMNGDGLDDMARLHMSNIFQVDYQNSDGSFSLVNYGTVSNDEQWGMSLGDIDNTGHKDLICGGNGDGVHHLQIAEIGTATQVELNNGQMFMQCNNIADIDNDSYNDFFACHDLAPPRIWLNDGNGNLVFDGTVIDFSTNPSTDGSGNYGSEWIDVDGDGDLDLYIAKCKQGELNINNPRRWNQLFINNGNGTFTEEAELRGVQSRYQSWTGQFGDIDNDGDLDLVVTNHDHTIQLFQNDGNGYFTEITAGSGLEITGFFLQSKFADFDNDGFQDLLIAGGTELFFRNNGNSTFSQVNGLFPAGEGMHSFATGDLNNDGFIDVFASYGDGYVDPDPANPDRLWMNDGNDNHWLAVRLQGTSSNRDAIGAHVSITGPWGTQVRVVRAGESYGTVHTFTAHFGLGTHTTIPTMTIDWPSGLQETFTDVPIDQAITVIEGTCIAPVASIGSVGAAALCSSGGTVTLEADAGYNYDWSTGAQTQQITVTTPGWYSITIDDGNGCNAQASVFVPIDPDETPLIEIAGEIPFCEGSSIELTAATPYAPTWNTGATTNSITVTEAGSYSVSITGACESFTSETIEVGTLAAPEPIADDVSINIGEQATLNASGENIQWYDQPIAGTPVASGDQYVTPPLTETTSYWVSSTTIHPGEVASGGKTNNSAVGGYHNNTTYYLRFDAYESFTIQSVKVYANGTNDRTIALVDENDGSTVASGVFNIPDGESIVQLGFVVPSAGSYGLRTVGGNPQLWRDLPGSGVSYPYPLGNLGAITGSTAGAQLYYFFYDWQVASPDILCESNLEEVVVTVGPTDIDAMDNDHGIQCWPNPALDRIMISTADRSSPLSIGLNDMLGRSVIGMHGRTLDANGRIALDISGLSAGNYMLVIESGSGRIVRQVAIGR